MVNQISHSHESSNSAPVKRQPSKSKPYSSIGLIIGILVVLAIVMQFGGYITARVINLINPNYHLPQVEDTVQ